MKASRVFLLASPTDSVEWNLSIEQAASDLKALGYLVDVYDPDTLATQAVRVAAADYVVYMAASLSNIYHGYLLGFGQACGARLVLVGYAPDDIPFFKRFVSWPLALAFFERMEHAAFRKDFVNV